jgi:hypothetical protein
VRRSSRSDLGRFAAEFERVSRTIEGKAELVVEIHVRYLGPRGDKHCYLALKRYDPLDNYFYSQKGSLSCDQGPYFSLSGSAEITPLPDRVSA